MTAPIRASRTHAKPSQQRPSKVALTKMLAAVGATVQRAAANPQTSSELDILALQKMAGNRAVNQLLTTPASTPGSTTPTIQRKVANASVLGVTDTAEEGPIFDSRVAKGKVFSKTAEIETNDTLAAIDGYQKAIPPIGQAAAGFDYLDKNMNNWANNMPSDTNWANNRMNSLANVKTELGLDETLMEQRFGGITPKTEAAKWLALVHVQRDYLRNNGHVSLIDPFLVDLTLTSKRRGDQNWVITTQFADSATGYITKVVAGNKNITGSIVSRGEFDSQRSKETTTGEEFIYSSTHEGWGGTFGERAKTLAEHEEDDQRGTYSSGFDAITWMAAEGARFEPVRWLKGRGTPETNFYVRPHKSKWVGARTVTLSWLMQNWRAYFGRAYSNSFEDVAAVVANHGTPIHTAPDGLRVNLTQKRIEE